MGSCNHQYWCRRRSHYWLANSPASQLVPLIDFFCFLALVVVRYWWFLCYNGEYAITQQANVLRQCWSALWSPLYLEEQSSSRGLVVIPLPLNPGALPLLVPQQGTVFHSPHTWNYYPSCLSSCKSTLRLSCCWIKH